MGTCFSTETAIKPNVLRPYEDIHRKLWAEKARSIEGNEADFTHVMTAITAVDAEKMYMPHIDELWRALSLCYGYYIQYRVIHVKCLL